MTQPNFMSVFFNREPLRRVAKKGDIGSKTELSK